MMLTGKNPSLRKKIIVLFIRIHTFGKYVFIILRFKANLFFLVIWVIYGKWFTRLGYYNYLIYLIDNALSVQIKVKWSIPNWNPSSSTAIFLIMG